MSYEFVAAVVGGVSLSLFVVAHTLFPHWFMGVKPSPEWEKLTGLRQQGPTECFAGEWRGLRVVIANRPGAHHYNGVGGARVDIPASFLATVEWPAEFELVDDQLRGDSLRAAAVDLEAIRALQQEFKGELRIHRANLVAEVSGRNLTPREVLPVLSTLRKLADILTIPEDVVAARAIETALRDSDPRRRASALRALTVAHARFATRAAEAGLNGPTELRRAALLCLAAGGRKLSAGEEDWLAANEPGC